MPRENGGSGTYQLIRPPNLLKAKVGNGTAPGVDPNAMRKAQAAIGNLKQSFEDNVQVEATKLVRLARQLADGENPRSRIARKAYLIGHDVGGQGATYGYDLITDICISLCTYVERLPEPERLEGSVLTAHADAMRAVVGNRVEGTGGELGADLIASLSRLVERSLG